MTSPDWVILNANRGGQLECLRCGQSHLPNYPIDPRLLSAMSKTFEKIHRRCLIHQGGLHCCFCGTQGHAPEACPRLNATTPEQWLAGPDNGISSRTIYGALHSSGGYHRWPGGEVSTSVPLDPGDFGRCYRLLKLFPAWRARLPEVAAMHPEWRGLVEAWDELTALYEEELPTGKCPKLYARMQMIIDSPRRPSARRNFT